MIRNTFKKEERLCSKRLIDDLFHNGSSFVVYPFRIVYLLTDKPLSGPVEVLISVPKRRFKLAVARNKIKRKMRECYRIHKYNTLYSPISKNDLSLLLAVQYVGSEDLPYETLFSKLKVALTKVADEAVKLVV